MALRNSPQHSEITGLRTTAKAKEGCPQIYLNCQLAVALLLCLLKLGHNDADLMSELMVAI